MTAREFRLHRQDFLIDIAERGIHRFRDIGRPFETHNSLTPSWATLPLPICAVTWFTFYNAMRDYVRQATESADQNRMMYIYGTVMLPTYIIPYAHVRHCVYNMFLINIPHEVAVSHTRVRFRLLFVAASWVPDRVSIDNITCRMEYSPPFYRDNFFEI